MVIYVDSSVVLATLLGEQRAPHEEFWSDRLITSRLTHYEVWNRINGLGPDLGHAEWARALLGRVRTVELFPPILERALHPFPVRVRTLDALHLASCVWASEKGRKPRIASYDARLRAAAEAL